MSADPAFRSLEALAAKREAEEEARRLAEVARQRSLGIAAVLRESFDGRLYAAGPDLHGAVTLYAMADGTVRWKVTDA